MDVFVGLNQPQDILFDQRQLASQMQAAVNFPLCLLRFIAVAGARVVDISVKTLIVTVQQRYVGGQALAGQRNGEFAWGGGTQITRAFKHLLNPQKRKNPGFWPGFKIGYGDLRTFPQPRNFPIFANESQ